MRSESESTKLGILTEALAAAVYLSALCGGTLLTACLTAYVLYAESSIWLKKNVLRAVILMLVFGTAQYAFEIIPSIISIIDNLAHVLSGYTNPSVLSRIISIAKQSLSIVKTITFIALCVLSLTKREVIIPKVDNFIEKNNYEWRKNEK